MIKKIFYIVNVDWFFLSHRLELALSMKNHGYAVFVLAKDSGYKSKIISHGLNFIDIDFNRAGKNPLQEIGAIYKLYRAIAKHKPEIVHNVTIKPSLYGSIAGKLAGVKVVNAISGLGYNFSEERNGFVQKVLKKIMNVAFNRDVNFIFQNPDDLAKYEEFGYLSKNKFKLIKGAGVDANEFSYQSPIEKDRLQVVLPARMLRDKGIREFSEAADILMPKWRNKALFRLIGDVDSDNPAGLLPVELQSMRVPDYFIWDGYSTDIKTVLREADIVVLPSYREGLPKSLIEAMAIGRPIVTTDVPGCRECVENNYNGFLVPRQDSSFLAEAIEKLLLDSRLRLSMGQNSRDKMVRELSLEKVLDETMAFYNEI